MKRKIKIILLISLFFFPLSVFATQGACSYHNGVDCSAGPDWDGSVICNDGWKDSSVNYYDAFECQMYKGPFSPCVYPIASGCTTEDDLGRIRATCARSGTLGSPMCQLKECQQQIDKYQRELKEYNECIIDWQQQEEKEITDNLIEAEKWKRESNYWEAMLYCAETYGIDSVWNTETNKCECKDNYWLSGGKCKLAWSVCINMLGPHAEVSPDSEGCECEEGYRIEQNPTRCEKIVKSEPLLIPEPTKSESNPEPEPEFKPESESKIEPIKQEENSKITETKQESKSELQPQSELPKKSFLTSLLATISNFFSNLFKLLF